MQSSLARRLVAEAVGTGLLVLLGAGSVVAAKVLGNGTLNFAGLGFVSLAFAFVIAVAVYAFGPVSGAHINPAVTVALAAGRRFAWPEVLPYVLAQLVGGFGGALLIVAIFGKRAVNLGLGATTVTPGTGYWQAALAEALATFLLLLTVMALAVDSRAPLGWAGLMIGLAVAAAILLIGPLTGGSLNPARTTGPYAALAVFGGTVPWSQLAVYWIGPIVGGAAAVLLYDLVAEPRAAEAAAPEEAYQPTTEGKRS